MDFEGERSNRSIDQILEHLNSNMNMYHPLQYPANSNEELTCDGTYAHANFCENEYLPQSSLSFILKNSPSMMPPAMNDSNFIIYGDQENMSVPSINNYASKTNGNLREFGEYDPRIPTANYNLFNNVDYTFPNDGGASDPVISSHPPLINNFVGNWVSNQQQNGTYSPFGMKCVDMTSIANSQPRKTKMVAEVKPMRPSYSDVLSKSVSSQTKTPLKKESSAKTAEVKPVKNIKSFVIRSLSGSGNWITKTTSDMSGSNSSLKMNGGKKPMMLDRTLKKWASLDDLKKEVSEGDFLKKTNTGLKKGRGGWETIQPNNTKIKSTKNKASTANIKPIPKDKEKDNKSCTNKLKNTTDDRKGQVFVNVSDTKQNNVPNSAHNSNNVTKPGNAPRRNSRVSTEKAASNRKDKRLRKRDGMSSWMSLIQQRIELVCSIIWAALIWLMSLVVDVLELSGHLVFSTSTSFLFSSKKSICEWFKRLANGIKNLSVIKRIGDSRFWPFRRRLDKSSSSSHDSDDGSESGESPGKKKKVPGGLKRNIPLPSTGEEAMKRLLSCKGKDPYSILGVTQDCTDDDIKKYYKRQAFLVHPDKNNQPGAEEAFKILVHAFDIIGEPEHRKSYDRSVEKTAQAEQAWTELSDLLTQLHKKMDFVANTIRCTNCGKRHKRTLLKQRPIYAARMCAQCKIHHSVREGDIWAETSFFGLIWKYFACMEGSVYDISEWAACQGDHLKNLKANTHNIQYRIVLGKHAQKSNNSSNGNSRSQQHATSYTANDPDLEEFINNLCSKSEGVGGDSEEGLNSRKRRNKRKK